MPLSYLKNLDKALLGIWKITEDLETLSAALKLQEVRQLEVSHKQKTLERLAVRVLLKNMLKSVNLSYQPLQKTKSGKPYFSHISHKVSISHCFPYAAAIIHPIKEVGIDIQMPVRQVSNVFERMMNKEEVAYADTLYKKTIYWSAKEALYKWADQEGLFFKEEIKVRPKATSLMGKVRSSDWIPLNYFAHDEHIVVWLAH